MAEVHRDSIVTIVETGDVQTRVTEAADDATLLVIGATRRGLISRLVGGSLVLEVLKDVDRSVLLAEKCHERTLRERLLGSGLPERPPNDGGVTPNSTGGYDETAG